MKCKQCSAVIKNSNKFCTKSCAASFNNSKRVWSKEVKDKICASMKKHKRTHKHYRKFHKVKLTYCKICNVKKLVSLRNMKKTCSKECYSKQQALAAISQYKTGYGKSGSYQGIKCQSRFELCYVIWALDNSIKIQRTETRFVYWFENKKHFYTPDFLINGNELIEIKGRLTLRDKEKFKAAPEVKIITPTEACFYIDYVRNKFNVKYDQLDTLYQDHIPEVREQLNCSFCNVVFSRKTKKSTYCSQSCSGKHRAAIKKILKQTNLL